MSFDDGYLSNYVYGYDILKKYGFTAVVFPVVKMIEEKDGGVEGNELPRFSWDQIIGSQDVFEFGSHTYAMHGIQNGKEDLIVSPQELVERDLRKSRWKLGNTESFAYPFGAYNEATITYLKEAGYKMAFTTKGGVVTQNTNPYEINRYAIYPTTTIDRLKQLLK